MSNKSLFTYKYKTSQSFPDGSVVNNPPAVWETWVWSLGWEDSLEEEMATHSSILSWRIPQTEEPGRLQSTGSQRGRHNWSNYTHTHTQDFPPAWISTWFLEVGMRAAGVCLEPWGALLYKWAFIKFWVKHWEKVVSPFRLRTPPFTFACRILLNC